MGNISINMELSPKQKEVLGGSKRFTLWRAGRRSGKTHGMEYLWTKKALSKPNSINWYVAQDTALCKELNIPLFEKIVPHGLIKDYSRSDKCFILFNGARCYFKSANSADSLRGRAINNLGCEEPAFWQNGFDIFYNILRPQLADTMGSAMLISSPPNKKAPKGAEWFRRLENSFRDEIKNGSQEHAVFTSNIYDNPFIN
ncbi:MAG: terminase family protein, partial [Candidatus Paceibacterota bacterium]